MHATLAALLTHMALLHTPGVANPPAAFGLHRVECSLLCRTNAQRARHGLPPLKMDMGLIHSARRHTAWMTRSGNLQHASWATAENIAMGQRTAGEAMASWMNSPGHRANILNGSYRRMGVAAYRAPDGTCYWCQQFSW